MNPDEIEVTICDGDELFDAYFTPTVPGVLEPDASAEDTQDTVFDDMLDHQLK